MNISETETEQATISWIESEGYKSCHGQDISPDNVSHVPRSGMVAGDNAPSYFHFKNGAYAMVHSAGDFGVELIGTKGRIILREGYQPSPNACTFGVWTHDSPAGEWQPLTTEWNELVNPPHFKRAYVRMVQELIDCIEEDRKHCSCGEEGRAALELIMAIYESQRIGARVKLPLDVRTNPLKLMS